MTVAGSVCWCMLFISGAKKRKIMRNVEAHVKGMFPMREGPPSLKPPFPRSSLCPQVSSP